MIKRIIICTTSNIPYDRRMQRISKALNENGFDVTWYGMNRTQEKIRIDVLTHTSCPIFNKGPFFYLEFNLRLFFYLVFNFRKFDCINAVDLDTVLASKIWSFLFKKKMVFDAHEYFEEVPELHSRRVVKKIWSTLGLIAISRNKYNYTVNQSLAELFTKKYKQKFSIVRNVPKINNDNKHSISKDKHLRKTLIYLGVVNQGRGVIEGLKALKLLPDYKMFILGEGDLIDEVNKFIQEHQLNERVRLVGWVDPKNINVYLEQGSIGLNLLDAISKNYEYSLANKFFDYIHANLPSINMDFPEYSKIIKTHPVGITTNSLNEKDLVDTIKQFEHESNYYKMLEACSIAQQLFNWEKEKEKLIQIYNEVFE